MVLGLRHQTHRTVDGQPVIEGHDGEAVMHVQEGVAIALGSSHPLESPGTLFITSKQVVWLSDIDTSKGYAVDFLSISLHAISRDPEAYPSPCIYAQIDIEDEEEDESEGSDSEESSSPLDLSKVKEMRLVPSDPAHLARLFEVFCECAELNPEPTEEEEEEHKWIFSADQLGADAIDGEECEWNSGIEINSIGHVNGDQDLSQTVLQVRNVKQTRRKERMKRKLMEESKKLKRRGVCYLSRVPPKMDPLKLRHTLSQYGEVLRLYLVPQDSPAKKHHTKKKAADGFRGQSFTEGWVEFTDKHVAKRVANMLNGEQIGGKRKSPFFYDIWNIKYLSKFKWDDLTEEAAYKNAVREQKLVMEMSAARKEREFYLSNVEKSRALTAIDERIQKRQKLQQGVEANLENHVLQLDTQPKVVRSVPQTKPVVDIAEQNKTRLSKNLLAEVFNN